MGEGPTQHLLTVPLHPGAAPMHAGEPVRWLEATVAPLSAAASPGEPAALVLLFDVTERRALDRRLDQAMRQDPLTGLANRDELMRRLSALDVVTDGPDVGLLFLDLDRFKRVNDYRGHAAGDEVLMAVAGRVSSVVRPEDLVARVGGDEFVVLCPRLAVPTDARAIAERVRVALDEPLDIGGRGLRITTSVGVATAPVGSLAPAALLHAADVAMYAAKQAGRNQVSFDLAGPGAVPGRRLPAFRRAASVAGRADRPGADSLSGIGSRSGRFLAPNRLPMDR